MSKPEVQQQMFHEIEEYKQSGLSLRAYCIANNINEPRFHYWVRKYKRQMNPDSGFIKIENKSVSKKQGFIEIIYPNGVRLYTDQIHELKNIVNCW